VTYPNDLLLAGTMGTLADEQQQAFKEAIRAERTLHQVKAEWSSQPPAKLNNG
jgi:hypothetical protein